jgi:uncharacterized membrane protein HdeD (DUF308 family)
VRTAGNSGPPQAPRWLVLLIAALSTLIGIVLVTRPFASLAVLILVVAAGFIVSGLADLAASRPGTRRQTIVTAGAWLVAGIAILVWPAVSLSVLAVSVAIALIVSGALRCLRALSGTEDQGGASLLLGAASIILGLLAVAWPDLTLLVVAVVFGIRLVAFGLAGALEAVRGPRSAARASPGRLHRWSTTAAAALALLLAVGLAAVSLRLNEGVAVPDEFYAAPASAPKRPGQLLRSEPFTRVVPAGARMWRILYTTTRADGVPAVASALVAAPNNAPDGPRPLIAWSHGTTGVAEGCAPSLLPGGIESGSPNAIAEVLDNGWVMVSTDYIGLGTSGPHAYLVGQQTGRAVLDSIRAAHQMPELDLEPRSVVWGHSQGGHGALWAGIEAATYAPDTNVIGVAALSPASDLPALAQDVGEGDSGAIFASYVVAGYSGWYPDVRVDDYIRPTARLQVREIASRCLTSEALVSAVQTLFFEKPIWHADPASGPLGDRLAENVPLRPIEAPLLVAQGAADQLVLPTAQASFVQARCAAGDPVDYRVYASEGHLSVVAPDSPLIPELMAWTRDRLDGRAASPTCGR